MGIQDENKILIEIHVFYCFFSEFFILYIFLLECGERKKKASKIISNRESAQTGNEMEKNM